MLSCRKPDRLLLVVDLTGGECKGELSAFPMFDELIKFFVVLLVVVEPLSLLPILAGLTAGAGDAHRNRMAMPSGVMCARADSGIIAS